MVAKAQGQELRKGVLGSLLRNLSTVTGPRLLLLFREKKAARGRAIRTELATLEVEVIGEGLLPSNWRDAYRI